MNLSRICAEIFAIFLLNSTFSTTLLLQSQSSNKSLKDYVCKITKDILKPSNDTQDVLIGNLDSKSQSSPVNDLVECIGPNYPVVISDMVQSIAEKNLKKAAVVILVFKKANKVNTYSNIKNKLNSLPSFI